MPRGRRSRASGGAGGSTPPPAGASLPSIKLRLPKLGQKSGLASDTAAPPATSSDLSDMASSSTHRGDQGDAEGDAQHDADEDEDEDMADVTQTQVTPQRRRRSAARDSADADEEEDGGTPSPSKRGQRKGGARRRSVSARASASPAKRRGRGPTKFEDEDDDDGGEDAHDGSQGGEDEEQDEHGDEGDDDDDDDDDGDDKKGSQSKVPWMIQIESGQSSLVHRAVAKIQPRHRVGRGIKGAAGRNRNDAAEADEEAEKPSTEEPVPPQEEYEVIVNKQKTMMKGEEVIMDEDEQGNAKIDENGELLGGRKYKCPVFSSPFRSNPKLLFAPAIECARALGYKDSLHFFRTNLRLIKITLTQREKDHLIEKGQFSNMVRGRNVTVVAMRNVFKVFGHKIVEGGRFVTDDYFEAQARGRFGAKEGQRHAEAPSESAPVEAATGSGTPAGATNEAPIPGPMGGALAAAMISRDVSGKRRDRNAQAAARRNLEPAVVVTHDANGETIMTTFGDAGYAPLSRIAGQQRKRRELESEGVSDENWMLEMARSVRALNADVAQARRERATVFPPSSRSAGGLGPVGWYEPSTNSAHFSLSTQPTRASLEKVYPRPLLEPGMGGAAGSAKSGDATNEDEDESMDADGDGEGEVEGDSDVDDSTMAASAQQQQQQSERLSFALQRAVDSAKEQRPVLGGSKVGSRAYGVASFEERVLPPPTLVEMGLGKVWGVGGRRKEGVAVVTAATGLE